MQSLPILKVSYNDDIRRVPLSSNDFTSFQDQIAQLFSMVDKGSMIIKYKDDEGDLISIFTNEELKEAIQNNQKILRIWISLKNEPKRKTLKRKIKRNKEKCNQQNNSPNNSSNNTSPSFQNILNDPNVDIFSYIEPLYNNIFQEGKIGQIIENVLSEDYSETVDQFLPFFSSKNNNDDQSNVHNAFCDRCDQKIIGVRWKCFECPDFDYCNDCYIAANGKEDKKTHLKEHIFGKIVNSCKIFSFQEEKEKHLDKLRLEKQEKEQKERQEKERQEKERMEKEEKERMEKEEKERQEKERMEKEEKERQEKRQKEEELKKQQENPPKPEIIYPFEQKLQDLQNMGFNDRKRNIQVLIKYKGNMNYAVQDLVESN